MSALVDLVREDIKNAMDNGYNVFTEGGVEFIAQDQTADDTEVANDLAECTGGYDQYSIKEIAAAVAVVRAEYYPQVIDEAGPVTPEAMQAVVDWAKSRGD